MQDSSFKAHLGTPGLISWPDDPGAISESVTIHNRGSEPSRRYFRCERFFTVGHEWYFTTREGLDIGPYASRPQAEIALAKYVARRCATSPDGVAEMFHGKGRETTPLEAQVGEVLSCWQQRRLRSGNSAYVWARQRLQQLRQHPETFDHASIRSRVLEHLLRELDK
jgi:hypothetical protein